MQKQMLPQFLHQLLATFRLAILHHRSYVGPRPGKVNSGKSPKTGFYTPPKEKEERFVRAGKGSSSTARCSSFPPLYTTPSSW